jgi:hypothetical protein
MKSYAAYFVPASKREVAARLFGSGRLLAKTETVAGTDWVVCGYYPGAAPPDDDVLWGRASLTQARSTELGEVIFLYADTSPDSFVYEHALGGVMRRKLVWFPLLDAWTAGWLCADGDPEAWEAAAFFRPERLSHVIEDARAHYANRGEAERFPAREAEIRRVWLAREMAPRSTIPRCDGGMALLVERHCNLRRP